MVSIILLFILVHGRHVRPAVVTSSALVSFKFVGFEVLTPVVMKSSTFWDITPCSPLKVKVHFGGICRLQLQGSKNDPSKKPVRKLTTIRTALYPRS
jgi:hypothetical protein